ncbi:MAG: hypothetical protein JRM78_03990 [Nitrososphaerota archaeon]|jgi:hypothetical protein|nr:hypothetical protein [Nitrososphaerota archaeon]
MLTKNDRIAETRKNTKERHRGMTAKSFEVLKNHLDATTLKRLTRVFIEAKWFTNYAIAQGPYNTRSKKCR